MAESKDELLRKIEEMRGQSGLDEREFEELLQRVIGDHFERLRMAGKLEQRQLERWLEWLIEGLESRFQYDLKIERKGRTKEKGSFIDRSGRHT
jgi:hypothetical protein